MSLASEFQCELWTQNWFGVQVSDPFIVPTSLLAGTIGVLCGTALWRKGMRVQALPELMFAFMMLTAMVAHCFSASLMNGLGQEVFWFVDAAATSTVALTFGFIGLLDVGVLKDDNSFLGYLFLADLPVVAGWYYAFFVQYNPAVQDLAFKWLYVVLILVTCGFFGIVQLYFIVKGRFVGGLVPLLVACSAGYVGIRTMQLCSWPDVRFSGEVWWFLLSDISMYFLYVYFKKREIKE